MQTESPSRGGAFVVDVKELLNEFSSPLVAHVAGGNDDDVDNPPDAKSSAGDQFEKACSPFTDEHAVNAESADKDRQDERDCPVAWSCFCSSHDDSVSIAWL